MFTEEFELSRVLMAHEDIYFMKSDESKQKVQVGDKTKETIITPDESDSELLLKSIKQKLMTAQLRAHWFKDHQNEHTLSEVSDLVEELEQEIALSTF